MRVLIIALSVASRVPAALYILAAGSMLVTASVIGEMRAEARQDGELAAV